MTRETAHFMVNQLQNGKVERSNNKYGHIIGSSYPHWFKKLSKQYKTSKKETVTILEKLLNNKPLTDRQHKISFELHIIANDLSETEPELISEIDVLIELLVESIEQINESKRIPF